MNHGSQPGQMYYGGHPGAMQYPHPQGPGQFGPYQAPMQASPPPQPPKKKTKKRLAAVAAISAAMLASAGVYATTLTVTAKNEAGGTEDVVSCDPDGVNVEAGTPTYNAVSGQYEATSIVVTGIAATCDTMTLYVTAAEADGTSLVGFDEVYDDGNDNGTITETVTAFALEDLDKFVVAIQEA
jgi:hypothetical protein